MKEYAIYHNSVLLFNILYDFMAFVAIIRYIKSQNTLRKVDWKRNIILNNHVNTVVIDYIGL